MEEALQAAGGPVAMMRDLGVGRFTAVRDEFSTWIEEQRSWQETVGFMDQSYHMTDHYVEGPDALEFYSNFAVNNFLNSEPGKAKQLVTANPKGEYIGDAIVFHLDDEKFLSVGGASAHNWLQYHIETGDWDVTGEIQKRPVQTGEDPTYFRFQVQGPDALNTMEEAVDGEIPEIGFFNFTDVTIDGVEVNLLRHGMAGAPGFEFFGDYEHKEEVKSAVLEAGAEYDISRVGATAYQTPNIVLGWVPLVVPAIFGDDMTDYREWLTAGDGILSIGGSFESDDISDYYFTPDELGFEHIINFDQDFVGKEALQEKMESPSRTKVTLEWNPDDILEVFGSLFTEGESYKYLDLPHPRWAACPYDEVTADGQHVGVSTDKSYVYNQKAMLSLAMIDTEYAEPGTEVSITWGDPAQDDNRMVERHEMTEIRATVKPAPYIQDER